MGDLHGDLDKAISALKLAQCIAVSGEGVVSWIGGDTTLVQLGDVLDRGDVEIGGLGGEGGCHALRSFAAGATDYYM